MKRALVVGAGAGGAAAARILANSFDVTLIEAGGEFSPMRFDPSKFEPMRKRGLFFDPRMIHTVFRDMHVEKSADMVHVYGSGIGGTTNLSTANALRYDGALRELGTDLDEEFAELGELVPQTTDHRSRWPKTIERCFEAFERLGLEPRVMPKMIDLGKCVNCGLCVLGCKHGAKWTSAQLLDERIDVRTGYKAVRIALDVDGNARGILCQHLGLPVLLEADVILLAAGGIGTPRILQESGIVCEDSFFGDPVLCVAAPLPGAHVDRTLPMPFASQRERYILSPYFDYLSFFFDKRWRSNGSDILSLMIKAADEECGRVERRGIAKDLTDRDYMTLAHAVNDCMDILDELGIDRESAFYGLVNEGHPGGCYPLTAEQAVSLHHSTLPDNVYLADSTLFPQSMGNPPILTIMALAMKVAKAVEARF